MKPLAIRALRLRGVHLAALAVAAAVVVIVGCRSAADAWEPREVSREQAENRLTRVLRYAAAAASVEEIAIAGRDIWAVAADAALTVHPKCASVVGSGSSAYGDAKTNVVRGLGSGSPLPADVTRWQYFDLYGEPSRTYIDERRIVLLWLRLGAPHDVAVIAAEYVPKSDSFAGGAEVDWRRSARIHVSYCYDADGVELANFDRAALPPLSSVNLADSSLSDEVHIRVRQPGEFLCGAEVTPAFDVSGLDENAPEYSGAAPGSDPTPAMLQALEGRGGGPDDFEVWYVVGPRRVLFASVDDREHDPTVVGRYADVHWLGFDAEGAAVWGVETSGVLYHCEDEDEEQE